MATKLHKSIHPNQEKMDEYADEDGYVAVTEGKKTAPFGFRRHGATKGQMFRFPDGLWVEVPDSVGEK